MSRLPPDVASADHRAREDVQIPLADNLALAAVHTAPTLRAHGQMVFFSATSFARYRVVRKNPSQPNSLDSLRRLIIDNTFRIQESITVTQPDCLATIRIAGQRQLGLPVVSLPGRPPPA